MSDVVIQEVKESDLENILALNREAFGQNDEAALVHDLLHDPTAQPLLSLAAFQDNKVFGHILFTKVELEPNSDCSASILCPMAVLPQYQKQGIGGQLINEGFRILSERGVGLVFVLGYPGYYSRYGFVPAGVRGFQPTYEIEEKNADAWMVKALQPQKLELCRGRVVCSKTLNKRQYWVE